GGDAARFKIHGQVFCVKRRQCFRGSVPAEGSTHARQQLFDAEGLCDVVVGAGIERNDFVPFRIAHGQHDDRGIAGAANFPARLNAADAWQIDVKKDQIGFQLAGKLDAFLAGGSLGNLVTPEGKRGTQDSPDLRLVVNHENAGGSHRTSPRRTATGSVNEKTEPWPSWLVTLMVPPWAVTMALAIGKPMPVPRTR